MKKIVLVTGGFDPIHSGHIAYFNAARELGDMLVVGVNSDSWLVRKKSKPFMPWEERATIVAALHTVDRVINFDDANGTAIDAIRKVKEIYPNHQLIFANGGDRTKDNIPEMVFDDVEFVFGVGGENKANSSSWILEEWKSPKTIRPWGYYRVLYDIPGCKVKELVVEPGHKLSMQQHQHRAEYWFVSEGEATIYWDYGSAKIKKHSTETIHQTEWHQLSNETDGPLKIVEIQYGIQCDEADIQRR
jgi:cytidyltransferase-like protein